MDYCFTEIGAEEVVSVIRPGNARSVSVAERIGHRFLREIDYKGGPALVYGRRRPGPVGG